MEKKVICKKFNSTGELSKYLAAQTPTEFFKDEAERHGSYTANESYREWSHTATYEEADNLLLFGDKDLQNKIERAGVSDMRAKLESYTHRRQIYSSVVGFAANVPAYLSGTPNSMINVRQVRQKQKVLTVMYNTAVGSNISASKIIDVTAKFVSAIMIIEASGIRVNVYAGEVLKDSGAESIVFSCRIKDSGQKLDTLKMAYPLAHPSMLRRQYFRLLETADGVSQCYVHGYGTVVNEESEAQKILKAAHINNVQRIVCYYDINSLTAEQIAKMLTEGAK